MYTYVCIILSADCKIKNKCVCLCAIHPDVDDDDVGTIVINKYVSFIISYGKIAKKGKNGGTYKLLSSWSV